MFYMWVLFVRIDVLFVLLRCFNITVWVHDMLNELLKSSTSNYQRDWKKRKKRNHLLNFTVRLINVLSLHNINLMHHFISRRWWRHLIEILLLSLKTNFYLAIYYIHLEITGDSCNLIGPERCYLFTNRTILCSKSHLFSTNEKVALKQNNQSDFKDHSQ